MNWICLIYYKLTSQEDSSYVEVAKGSDGLYHLYPEPAQGQTVEEAYKKSITWKDEFTPHNGSTSGTVQYTINGALNSTDKELILAYNNYNNKVKKIKLINIYEGLEEKINTFVERKTEDKFPKEYTTNIKLAYTISILYTIIISISIIIFLLVDLKKVIA